MNETVEHRRPRTIEEVSAYIRQRNCPKQRSPIIWRKLDERRTRSHCNRFQVERRGEGPATRYFAFLLPATVIGHRLTSFEQAKEICEAHASPLALESPAATAAPVSCAPAAVTAPPDPPLIDREPGSDDDL